MTTLKLRTITPDVVQILLPMLTKYTEKSGDDTSVLYYLHCILSGTKGLAMDDNNTRFVIIHIQDSDCIWVDAVYSSTNNNALEEMLGDCREFAKTIPNINSIRWTSSRKAYTRGLKCLKMGEYAVDKIIFRMDL